jgi:pilus assembly protein CpaE
MHPGGLVAPETSVVLLISAEREAAARLAAMIQAPGRRVIAAPFGPIAQGRAAEAQLILIDRLEGGADPAGAVAQLRAVATLGGTPVLCIASSDDVEERVHLLEAGADDVVARPFHPDELRARIDALLAVPPPVPSSSANGQASASADSVARKRLVTFYSPKGGVGVTTLAVNTAVAAARNGRSVALVDLDLEWGQVATHLNLQPKFSVVELARDTQAIEDPGSVRAYAEVHSSGVSVFASPQRPDQNDMMTLDHVRGLLEGLSSAYDQVIVDGGSTFNDRSLTLLEQSDRVVLLVVPEIPAVRAVHTLLEMLSELGAAPERQFLLLNHLFQHDMLRLDDLERSVQATIQAELPYDGVAYLRAVNEGVPVLAASNKGATAMALDKVIAAVLDEPAPTTKSEAGHSRFRMPKFSARTPAKSRT